MMTIQWIGPKSGLGNRILALGSVLALSKSLQSTIVFPWRVQPDCPAEYNELFEEMPGIRIDNLLKSSDSLIMTSWEPIGIFQSFKKALKHQISLEEYCFYFIEALRSLRYSDLIMDRLNSHYSQIQNNKNLAIHLRRTDRLAYHKNSLQGLLSTKHHKRKKSFLTIKSTGLYKALQYSLLPISSIRDMENNYLAKICEKSLNEDRDLTYSIYADSHQELLTLQQQIRSRIASAERLYIPSYCNSPESQLWGTFGKRNTSIQNALIELLGMSRSIGILQNISVSS
ncbi:MAG: hypothetical protein WBM44_08755, partial [Waterburya sp.]